MNKHTIANWAVRLAYIAQNICAQVNGQDLELYQVFFLDLLNRQSVILRDISILLNANVDTNLSSVRILFRCILEDFIIVLYLHSHDFDKELIVRHTAKALKDNLDIQKTLWELNKRFFDGKQAGFGNPEDISTELDSLCENPRHSIFFKKGEKGNFKTFFSTIALLKKEIPITDVTKANVHALAVRKLLSKYVHYSAMTYFQEREIDHQDELRRFKEILTYVYKGVVLCSEGLTSLGVRNEVRDQTNVKDEIFEGSYLL
jgi:hypothetical protein